MRLGAVEVCPTRLDFIGTGELMQLTFYHHHILTAIVSFMCNNVIMHWIMSFPKQQYHLEQVIMQCRVQENPDHFSGQVLWIGNETKSVYCSPVIQSVIFLMLNYKCWLTPLEENQKEKYWLYFFLNLHFASQLSDGYFSSGVISLFCHFLSQ